MDEAVDDAAFRIESVDDPIEVASVAVLVASPNGPREQIGDLNETRGGGIGEQRDLGEIAQVAPSRALVAVTLCEALQGSLVARLVHHHQATLRFAIAVVKA